MAGDLYETNNNSYYLYTGRQFWTMIPYNYHSLSSIFVITGGGDIDTVNLYYKCILNLFYL